MAAIPTITPLPNPALSTDPEDVFNSKTDATLLAQQAMVPQLNTSIGGINSAVTQADGYRQAAATSAQSSADSAMAAAGQVALAADQVALANTARTDAQAARDSAQAAAAAAGSAAGLPSLAGNAGKFLGVNAAGNAVAWMDAGQKVGDVLTTGRTPDASYLSMNGGVYLQSAYPALFAVLGLIGGEVGLTWSSIASGYTSVLKIARGNNGTLVGITTLSNTVIRSTDNGATWTPINAGVVTYATDIDTDGNGKWIISLSTAVSTSGLRVSTDDGQTWTSPTTVTAPRAVIRYAGNNIWLAGGGNSTVRSSDNGATWAAAGTSGSVNTGSVMATDRNGTVVVYNSSGNSYRSADAFATAGTVVTFPVAPTAMATDNQGTWGAVGATGALMRSLDNGITFSSITSGTTSSLTSISTNGKGAWLVGGASLIRRSKDNLNTWEVASGVAGTIQGLIQIDTLALASSSNGQVYRSVPTYTYDTATQFKVPQQLNTPQGLNSYIKAKVTA